MMLIAAMLFLMLGIFCVVTPDTIWQLQHLLTVKDGEPTDVTLISIRVGGVIYLLLSMVIVAVMLFGII